MLKIKNNINLKELEKFGFIEECCSHYFINYLKTEQVFIDIDTREIGVEDCCNECIIRYEALDILFDLIKADLVEKVGE